VSDKETNINIIGGNNKYNERMIHGVVTSGDRMHACSIRGSTVEIPFPEKGQHHGLKSYIPPFGIYLY
jgi:hypothetical protein